MVTHVNRDKKLNDEITSSEISDAELLWIKIEQGFILKNKEFNQVKLSLNLFTDEKGLLRLGSKLKESLMSFENAHPILLRHSYFTRLLVECMHKEVLHSGLHATLNYIRSRFWICRGRQYLRSILRNCIICKKSQGKPLIGPAPPDLPSYRVSSEFAFATTGIDYAGPLMVKNVYNNDDGNMYKAYICLMTCAASRNVHLELTPSMDAASLIRALKRFLARRGI